MESNEFMRKIFMSFPLFLFLTGILFTFINYSKLSWTYFYKIGGLPLAKTAPEGIGLAVFSLLAFLAWKNTKPNISFFKNRLDILIGLVIAVLAIAVRLTQLKLYFFQDDYWFWLCRTCGGYTVFRWEPWLSSHPGLAWEATRYFAGFSPIPYEVVLLLSNASFAVGLYILARFVSKNRFIGFFSAFFFLSTTLNFDAFRWISHVIGFGWQGLLMMLAMTALIYELNKFKGKQIPLTAIFLIMAAVGSGTARTGAVLFVLSFIDIIVCFSWLSKRKIREWIGLLFRRQMIYVLFPVTFAYVRELIGSAAKSGVSSPLHKPFPFLAPLSVPVYKLFLFVVGIFITPPEAEEFIRTFISGREDLQFKNFILHVFGSIYGALGLTYILFTFILIIVLIKKRKNYLLVALGLVWTLCFAAYFTYFGSDLPVDTNSIWSYIGPHYLAYTSSAGISFVIGYVVFAVFDSARKVLYRRFRLNLLTAFAIPLFLLFLLMCIQVQTLENRYNDFAHIAFGQHITLTQFFFNSYRKIIPTDKKRIVIVYDDIDAIQRPGTFHPDSRFFQAFWPNATITVLDGSSELQKFLLQKNEGINSYSLNDIYYILTDYQNNGLVIDMSSYLRDKIKNTANIADLQIITESEWDQILRKNIPSTLGNRLVKREQAIPARFNPADLIHLPSVTPFPIHYQVVNPDSGWRDYPYKVKRFLEKQISDMLRFSPSLKEKYLISLLNVRLMEVAYVANIKDDKNIENTTDRYAAAAGDLTNYTLANQLLYKNENRVIYLLLLRHIATVKTLLPQYDSGTAQWRFLKQDIDSLKLYANKFKAL